MRTRDGNTEVIPADAVVLASGGFQANAAWRTRYLGPGWDLAKVRGTRFNTDEGIRMALDIGARSTGNWSGCHAVGWDRNAPEFGDRVVGDGFQKHSYPFGNEAVQVAIPFNPNVKDGRGTEGITRQKSNWANRIDTPPFEAYMITCGITFTFGGLAIEARTANVLAEEGHPIPGLFACGELVGGLFYFNYPGGAGLTSGAVFGRLAGTQAARHGA